MYPFSSQASMLYISYLRTEALPNEGIPAEIRGILAAETVVITRAPRQRNRSAGEMTLHP